MTKELTISTCQAANTYPIIEGLEQYLTNQLQAKWGIRFRYVAVDDTEELNWNECYAMSIDGEIDLSWVCAATYAQRINDSARNIDMLAAPIFGDAVYRERPTYLSYVVVHAESSYQRFAELRCSTFCFNETVSHSGHNIVCAHLHELGIEQGFFGQAVASGGHVKSIHMIADGQADCAAIDSSVWLWYQTEQPDICAKLRVVELLGPYAAPPLIISRHVPSELAAAIRELLLNLDGSDEGRVLLDAGGLARFTRIDDAAYRSALDAVRLGESVPLVQ